MICMGLFSKDGGKEEATYDYFFAQVMTIFPDLNLTHITLDFERGLHNALHKVGY
jgi:hypothetical protein